MDGEKDPRNLLVAFQIVHVIITKNYTLGKLTSSVVMSFIHKDDALRYF